MPIDVFVPSPGTRTAVLVDVDGVLNPLVTCDPDRCGCHRGWIRKHVLPDGELYQVLLNPGHGRKLLDLAAETGSELVWASYWEHYANRWISPRVGLPDLPWVPIDAFPDVCEWTEPEEPEEREEPARRAESEEPAEHSDSVEWAASAGEGVASPGEWKALGVAKWSVAAGGRPFVWFEDEYDVPDALARLARSHPVGRYLVVGVDPLTGLTDDHLAEARAWLSDPPGGR